MKADIELCASLFSVVTFPADLPLVQEHLLSRTEEDGAHLHTLRISDEATFFVHFVDRHSCRVWGTVHPHDVSERERDAPNVIVCGVL
jgi:hypothetical protein